MSNVHDTKQSDLMLMAFQKPRSTLDSLASPKASRLKNNNPTPEDDLTREWDTFFNAKMRVAMSNHLKNQYNSYRLRTTSMPLVAQDELARTPSQLLSPKARKTFTSTLHNLNYQSSSTLQHSEVSVGFTKAKRFQETPIYSNEGFTYLKVPNTLSTRSCGFGLGTKNIFDPGAMRNARRTPAPNNYAVKTSTDRILQKNKIPTMGSPRTAYLRVYYPGLYIPDSRLTARLPGPGSYSIKTDYEKKSPITIKSKGKMFNELSEASPASNQYVPVETPVQSARFKDISFGLGTRYDFTKSTNKNPGPGTYVLPSTFPNSKKTPRKSSSQAADM